MSEVSGSVPFGALRPTWRRMPPVAVMAATILVVTGCSGEQVSADKCESVSAPLSNMLHLILDAIPRIIGAA